jgi:hypothetical protein
MIGTNPFSTLTPDSLLGQDGGLLSLFGTTLDGAPQTGFGSILEALDGFSLRGMTDTPNDTTKDLSASPENTAPFLPFLMSIPLPIVDVEPSPVATAPVETAGPVLDVAKPTIPLGMAPQIPSSENMDHEPLKTPKTPDADIQNSTLAQHNPINIKPDGLSRLPLVSAALPDFVPVANDVKTLVENAQAGMMPNRPLPTLMMNRPVFNQNEAPTEPTSTEIQAEKPQITPTAPTHQSAMAAAPSVPLATNAPSSVPMTPEDLDAALNAMANLRAPMQVADNGKGSISDRPLSGPSAALIPAYPSETGALSQPAMAVLAQAEPLAKKPVPVSEGDVKKKPSLTSAPHIAKHDAPQEGPQDTNPLRLASFEDLRQTPSDPVKTTEFSTVADASPLKVDAFGTLPRQESPLAQNTPLPTASLAASLAPLPDTAASASQRMTAFHHAATLTPMEVQHARENLAMTIKQGIQDDNTKIRIQMSPERLGTVDVAMDIAQDGTVNAVIGADRQETYDWLRRDASSLQELLQQAGLKMGQGGLSFAYHDQRQAFEQKVAGLKGRTPQADPDVKTVAMRPLSYNPNQALDIHA